MNEETRQKTYPVLTANSRLAGKCAELVDMCNAILCGYALIDKLAQIRIAKANIQLCVDDLFREFDEAVKGGNK